MEDHDESMSNLYKRKEDCGVLVYECKKCEVTGYECKDCEDDCDNCNERLCKDLLVEM